MQVLVTNDDGISSPGLRVLADAARESGHDVLVAAPSRDYSGASSSVTGIRSFAELVWAPISWDGWPADTVLSVDGSPALIALVAMHERFGKRPELVLSGINRGANTGRAILHSGTVGAAFTGFQHGCPALAMSLDVTDESTGPLQWETAAAVTSRVLDWITDEPRHVVLNCNVPNVPLSELAGIRKGTLDLLGTFQTMASEESGESVPVSVTESDGVGGDTDSALLARGYAAVTALLPVVEDPSVDLSRLLVDPGA